MKRLPFGARVHPRPSETRWRHRFSILTVCVAVALIGWGGFVTSIDAGMAVPDWPSSFGSFDPFETGFHDPSDPTAQWWSRVPILAEHGHRLLGALVGLLTLGLAVWTWIAEERRWMRLLGVAALLLVIAQGVLGGLRVVLVSLDLAVVHACVAQIFFSLLVAMALFTSRSWVRAEARLPATSKASLLRRLAAATVLGLYAQIILGALLRHPGTGIDPVLAGLHIAGAFVAGGLVIAAYVVVRRHARANPLLLRTARTMLGLLAFQVALGVTAYFVLLDESGVLKPSNFQVAVNTLHLIAGTLLLAASVCLALLALRRPAAPPAKVLSAEKGEARRVLR